MIGKKCNELCPQSTESALDNAQVKYIIEEMDIVLKQWVCSAYVLNKGETSEAIQFEPSLGGQGTRYKQDKEAFLNGRVSSDRKWKRPRRRRCGQLQGAANAKRAGLLLESDESRKEIPVGADEAGR